MRYEYVTVPYRDGTAEGEIPVKNVIEKNSNLTAICEIFFGEENLNSDREAIDYLIFEEYIEDSYKTGTSKEVVKTIEDKINSYFSLDEETIYFYIKNLDTGEAVFNNKDCSVKTWLHLIRNGWNGVIVDPELLKARGW